MNLLNNKIKLGPITLRVNNMARIKDFYINDLGFELIDEMSLGVHGKVLINLVQGKVSSTKHSGLYHVAFLLPSEQDLIALLYHLSDLNIELGASDHGVSQALYFNDPEGNGIEIYADREKYDPVNMVSDPLDVEHLVSIYNGEPWKGMPAGTKIGHVHLQLSDLVKAKAFYFDFLGMDLMTSLPSALFGSKAGYHHHLGMNTWNRATPDETGALVCYDIEVNNYEAIRDYVMNQSVYEYKLSDQGLLINDGQGIWTHIIREH